MLEELAEDRATGTTAQIYNEIRQTTRVPYVSSLQRHLATKTGWLEWAWSIVGPSFRDRRAQTIGWSAADRVRRHDGGSGDVSDLIPDADVAHIADIYRGFIRVSPTNLVTSAILKQRLSAPVRTSTSVEQLKLQLPELAKLPTMLAALPSLVDINELDSEARRAIESLSVVVSGKAFIPGLYRMIARWPDYLVHVANTIAHAKELTEVRQSMESIVADIDKNALILASDCPYIRPPVDPGSEEAIAMIAVIDNYRRTSPEMIVYSKLLLDEIIRR